MKPSQPFSTLLLKINKILLLERGWLKKIIIILWAFCFVMLIGVPLYVYSVISNPYGLFGAMPTLRDIENPENDLSSEIISVDGVSLGSYSRFHRSPVTYDELSHELVTCLLTSEDHR